MKKAIGDVLRDFSIEVTPYSWRKERQYVSLLPPQTRVFVTFLPQHGLDETLQTCFDVQRHGMIPVPHLGARHLRSAAELKRFVEVCQDLSGEALLLAGASGQPRGEYGDSLALLNSPLWQAANWRCLYFAGHPEGSPDIHPELCRQAEEAKDAYLRRQNVDGAWLTQFGFAADAFLAWAQDLRRRQLQSAWIAGLAGRASLSALIKYAQQCGVGMSLRFLMQKRSKVLNLFRSYDVSPMICALAAAKMRGEDAGLRRVHFFPFGAFKETLEWLQAVQAGHFELHDDGFRLT